MSHPTHAPPLPARTGTPPAGLSWEARMAATDAAMTVRLEEAAVAYEVNTAHIDTVPVDLADVVTLPLTPTLKPPTPYATPVAALLQRAHHRLLADGWCTGTQVDADGARCLYGAIHHESRGDQSLASSGLEVLMDAIHRQFDGDIDSVPSFNDGFTTGHIPLRTLDQAAALADARLL
ncbi:hypothetical protein ACIO3O_37550 [Streptomyces sp. NPDC087440]|uniref:DUF6197 family protein n=1 Tax=Streptomyces sp. NPDC087440 TaxID=3365790 RepID=UPI0037FE9D0F